MYRIRITVKSNGKSWDDPRLWKSYDDAQMFMSYFSRDPYFNMFSMEIIDAGKEGCSDRSSGSGEREA